MTAGLLAGTTVVDFSMQGPGPRCARMLADYGARVVRVRPPASNRMHRPPAHVYSSGRDFEHVVIDLKDPAGLEVAHRLIARADVVIESYRPGVADRLGVGYRAAKEANEAIVYCSVSGFGQDGPYADRPGHDLNFLGLTGYLSLVGRRADGGPAMPGGTIADAAGGLAAGVAILAALVGRGATGEGAHLDVSITEATLRLVHNFVDQFLTAGVEVQGGTDKLTGGAAWYDVYEAGDGRWLTVAAIEPGFWKELCAVLDLEQYLDRQHDRDAQDEIRGAMRAAFARRTGDEWLDLLGTRSCVGPVLTLSEIEHDPQLAARGLVWEIPNDAGELVRQMAPNLAGVERAAPPEARIPAPDRTDTDAVLRGLGLAAQEIAELRDRGIVN